MPASFPNRLFFDVEHTVCLGRLGYLHPSLLCPSRRPSKEQVSLRGSREKGFILFTSGHIGQSQCK